MSDLFGFGGGESEARHEEEVAKSKNELQAIANQFLSQLIPGSVEYNEFISQAGPLISAWDTAADEPSLIRELGSRLVSAQQGRIASGEPATGLEARTDLAFQGLRDKAAFTPEEQAIFNALRGLPQTGEGADLADIFSQLVSRAKTPESYFESTFQPELQLLQDQVKARAASRGILGSGLELEHLGRAGVELAIKQAQQKEAFRQSQLQNFFGLFDVGQGLRRREIGVEEALLNLQQGRESNLGALLGRESSLRTSDLRDLLGENLQTASGRVNEIPSNFEKFLKIADITSDFSFPSQVSSQSGQGTGTDVGSLLAAQQEPGVTGLSTSGGVTSLSRQAPTDEDGGTDWLKYLQAAMQAAQVAASFAA